MFYFAYMLYFGISFCLYFLIYFHNQLCSYHAGISIMVQISQVVETRVKDIIPFIRVTHDQVSPPLLKQQVFWLYIIAVQTSNDENSDIHFALRELFGSFTSS